MGPNDQFSSERTEFGRFSTIVWVAFAGLICFILWANLFELVEVTNGQGKIVPSSREQVIQSLEGGIVKEMLVKEGDLVRAGQVLANLDPQRSISGVDEARSRLRAALATSARLKAEVNGVPLQFDPLVQEAPELVASEQRLYNSRKDSLSKSLSGITEALSLVRKELTMTERLVKMGAASDVEVLRLKQRVNELEMKSNDIRTQYDVRAREELAKANAEIEAQSPIVAARVDVYDRLAIKSPVRGVVKDVTVTTVGGVIPPNGKLMEIVPFDDQLLVDARINPKDIAFIHPGQRAVVKVTAYDYAIYGGLEGKVVMISPDTIQDDVRKDQYYYRVFIRTDSDVLLNKNGKEFPIVPGMIVTADIVTGQKTIWAYLTKPLNRAREALRER